MTQNSMEIEMDTEKLTYLKEKAREIRYLTMDEIGYLGVGHIGGCLSIADVLAVLYFDEMRVRPDEPNWEDRDRFVLSKGHAGPALYAALAAKGYFDKSELHTLNRPHTHLPSHCDMLLTTGVDMTAGALGQGLSCAVGMAKAGKAFHKDYNVFCIIGDGESQEGQIWEASSIAAQWKLDNLYVFLDYNKFQIDGGLDDINSLIDPVKRWNSFGFETEEIDGNDIEAICGALQRMKAVRGKPKMIVLRTVKGKGVSYVEAAGAGNHNMTFTPEQTLAALKELE